MQEQQNTKLIFGIIGLSVVLFGGLIVAVLKAPSQPANSVTGVADESVVFSADPQSPSIGKQDSKVVVRLYSDFQCPACKLSEPAVAETMAKYKDRVKFIWKDFPLEQIHPVARAGAEAARCAETQGKFWEYHDELYVSQSEWSSQKNPESLFLSYADKLGLNKDQFTSCYQTSAHDSAISATLAEGFGNRVDRTPTVFINNKRYFSLSVAEWTALLDQALLSTGETTTAS